MRCNASSICWIVRLMLPIWPSACSRSVWLVPSPPSASRSSDSLNPSTYYVHVRASFLQEEVHHRITFCCSRQAGYLFPVLHIYADRHHLIKSSQYHGICHCPLLHVHLGTSSSSDTAHLQS